MIRRPSRSSSTARIPVRGSIPRSRQPRSSGPISPCPAPRSSRILRRSSSEGSTPCGAPRPRLVSLIMMLPGQLRPHRDPLLPGTERDEREQRALHRPAPARLGAGVLGMVVREVLDDLELDRRVLLQPGHHLGPGVDQRRGQVHVDEPVGQRPQVGQHLLPAVLDAELGHVRVHRDPHHAAGPGAGAADRIGLLEQPHAGARGGGPDRGGQRRGAGTQDDDIERFHRDSFALYRQSFYSITT